MTTPARVPGAQATSNDTGPAAQPRPINHTHAHAYGARSCPSCKAVLDGGPVQFWCQTCRATVHAADLSRETTRPLARRAAA